jgi:hypothetical protein
MAAQQIDDRALVRVRGDLAVDANQLEHQVDQFGLVLLEEPVHD